MVDPRMMRVWVGEGRGGSGFAVTYLTFCQNFAVGSAEEVWFYCLFFYTLKVTLLMREFLAALVSIITFFFRQLRLHEDILFFLV